MRRGVKPVRMRAGVPDYSDEVYENPKKFFEKIVHERQIEFFAETQRYSVSYTHLTLPTN